ncbi:MAG: type II CAAX endopeptidase family protein [bacterium]|jgi:membrane protease YdiL (CAAX protease family)
MNTMSEQLMLQPTSLPALIVGFLYIMMLLGGTLAASLLILRSRRSPIPWADRIAWLRARPWTWREGVGVLGLIGILIGSGWAISAMLNHPSEGTQIIIQGLTLDLAGIGGIAWLAHSRGWRWRESFGIGRLSPKLIQYGFVFYITLIPFMLISSLVYQGILSVKGYPPNLQDIAILLSGNYSFWVRGIIFVFAVAVAPFFEECLFRGIFLPIAIRKFGLGAGIFIVSLLFASIHFHLASFIPLLIIAAGFSIAYLYTKSLWVPIIMHGLFNGINLAMLLVIRP